MLLLRSIPPVILLKALVSTLVGNSGHYFFKISSLNTAVFNTSNAFISFNPKRIIPLGASNELRVSIGGRNINKSPEIINQA